MDEKALRILHTVHEYLVYVSDQQKWGISDKWQDPSETFTSRTGDCEDGAVLIYLLCRYAGIPASRLYLWCGDVTDPADSSRTAGHCCCFYRPDQYPLNFVALDWCYFYDGEQVEYRPKLQLTGKVVYDPMGDYRTTWFIFNEDHSFTSIDYRV